jgi:CubicO group peptidase (beta-lactamase class C family)
MKKLALLSALVALGWLHLAAGAWAGSLDQDIAEAIRSSQNVPNVGVSVGVVRMENGVAKLVFAKGYGYRDRARKLPATDRTMYVAGSMSKAFTSAALTMESEAGRVDLAQPVRGYLSDFKLASAQATRDATGFDLLSHQSGLPRHDCFWYLSRLPRAELFSRLTYLGFNLSSGQGFHTYQYNNLVYMAAGTLLERVSGDRWEIYMRDRLLKPLGMNSTVLDLKSLGQADDVALGYAGEQYLPYKDVESIAPAAAVNTNVPDMAKWLALHLGHGVAPSGKRLISEQGMESMYQARVETTPGSGNYYGLGWRLDHWAKRRWIRHAGNMDGFLGVISFLPETGVGTIVLTNQNDSPVPMAVTQAVLKNYYGAQGGRPGDEVDAYAEETGPRPAAGRPPTGGEPDDGKASALDGRYANAAYGEFQISSGEVTYGALRWRMRATSDANVYGVTLDLGGRTQEFLLKFTRDSAGRPSGFGVSLEESAAPFRFEKI